MTRTTRKPRRLALALVAALVLAILAARHGHAAGVAASSTRRFDRGGAAAARRPARAADPAAPTRLSAWLRSWAGVQLRPGLDR